MTDRPTTTPIAAEPTDTIDVAGGGGSPGGLVPEQRSGGIAHGHPATDWTDTGTGAGWPLPTTGIVAFIEARCEADDVVAFHMEDRRQEALTAMRRAILALHRRSALYDICLECQNAYPCQTVRLLAAIDADHPDYRPEWKPQA